MPRIEAGLVVRRNSTSGQRDREAALACLGGGVDPRHSDGRADREGATVISLGAAGIAALRRTECREPGGKVKKQDETFTDLVAAAAGIVLGQRGRGVPVTIVRGLDYPSNDDGVRSMLNTRHLSGHPGKCHARIRSARHPSDDHSELGHEGVVRHYRPGGVRRQDRGGGPPSLGPAILPRTRW